MKSMFARRGALAAVLFVAWSSSGAQPAAAAAKCPQILIVMDRTGSMTQKLESGDQKWMVISAATKAFTSKYSKSIRFGFEYFNGNGCKMPPLTGSCAPGCLLFDPKDDAGADVAMAIDALTPSGQTSTRETMEPLKDYMPLKDPAYSNFILLITDGLPNCTEEKDTTGMIAGGYTGMYSVAAIKAIATAGVPVFVLGVGTKGAPGVAALNTDILDMMADAGGVPQMGATHKFYAADNPAEVDAALEAIAGKAGGGTIGGCFAGGGKGGSSGGADGGGGSGGGQGGGSGNFDGGGGEKGSNPGCACRIDRPIGAAGAVGVTAGGLLLALVVARRRRVR